MLPSREFRFLSYVLGNIAPFLGCSENLAHTTLEVVNGFPRQPVAEFSAEEALQLFSREFTKLSLAESWIEMHVEHVPIVLLGCVFECWQNHGRPIVFDKIAKCTDGLRSRLATVDRP
jgi:hypothetical protein